MPTDFVAVLPQKGAGVSLISPPGEPPQCPWGGSVLTYSISAPGGHNHPTFPGGLYLKLWSPSKGTFSPGPKPLSGRIGHKRIAWSSEFPVASVDAVTARRGCWRENGVPGLMFCPREGAKARSERGRKMEVWRAQVPSRRRRGTGSIPFGLMLPLNW